MKLKNKRESKSSAKLKKQDKNFLVCDDCGKTTVQVQAWVDANTHKYMGCPDEYVAWCDACENHVKLTTIKEYNAQSQKIR